MRCYWNGDDSGQSTVEYAAVGAALIAVVIALGALWRFGSGGGLQELVQIHASHAIEAEGGVIDVLLY